MSVNGSGSWDSVRARGGPSAADEQGRDARRTETDRDVMDLHDLVGRGLQPYRPAGPPQSVCEMSAGV